MSVDQADGRVAESRSPGRVLRWCVYKVPGVMPALHGILRRMQLTLLSYFRDPADVTRIRQVYKACKCELQPLEAYAILSLARAQALLEGDMAEVGMFQGGSAKLICAVKGTAPFWGFDTFEGLVDVGRDDTHWGTTFFRNGAYRANEEAVRRFIGEGVDITLTKGVFPGSAGAAADRRFSFVHLDVDTYTSTLESLRFFWPRLIDRGLIVTHDSHAAGVARAAREFVAETGARTIPVGISQLMFLK
jgi:O-methyltransferase